MSEEQELEQIETTDDVEGHHHRMNKQGPSGAAGYGAEDTELNDEDDVEGHAHHKLKQ